MNALSATFTGFWLRARRNPAAAWAWACEQFIKQFHATYAQTGDSESVVKLRKLALWCAKRAGRRQTFKI